MGSVSRATIADAADLVRLRAVDGYDGHIASMATEPAHRGKGHASSVLGALTAWLQSRDVRRVDLFATEERERLYRAVGFHEPTWPSLVRTRDDDPR